MLRISLSVLLTAFVATVLLAVAARADDLKVEGGRFNFRAAVNGEPFASKGWSVDGEVTWISSGSSDPKDRAIRLAEAASVSRAVTVGALPKRGKEALDASEWTAFLSVRVRTDSTDKSTGKLSLQLSNEAGAVFTAKGDTSSGRLFLRIPASELVVGEWRLRMGVEGGHAVLDDVSLVRVPHVPSQMKFAKSNGPNGPDRLESGALGFAGWTAHRHAPLPVFQVREKSPAARAGLKPGDVIVAVDRVPLEINSCAPGWAWFRNGHETVFGRAVERALERAAQQKEASAPVVTLTAWRGERRMTLAVPFAGRRPLPENFPFDDSVTPRLYDDLMDYVRRKRRPEGRWTEHGTDWIQTSFAGLALLGRRDPKDAAIIKATADWFLARFDEPKKFGNLGFWSVSYAGIFMAEYYLASGDERVPPWMLKSLRWVQGGFHESKWGLAALGHGPSGLPYGNKGLMAPAAHVIVFEALARKCGVQTGVWEKLFPYMEHSWSDPRKKGHGAMGYNGSYKDLGEFWSRTGLFALACELRQKRPFMKRACMKVMRERHPWMRNSHAYGYPGDTWGLAGMAACDREAFREVMKEWRWAYGGAWEPGFGLRHTTAHMGSPYMGGEGLINPATAMLLSARHRGLFITGGKDRGWLAKHLKPKQ